MDNHYCKEEINLYKLIDLQNNINNNESWNYSHFKINKTLQKNLSEYQ